MTRPMEGLAARTAASGTVRFEWSFYSGMATAVLLTVVAGFGPSYYLKAFTDAPPASTLVHLHASVFTLWVLLFLVQTTLVAAGRTDLHRRLGLAGGVLAALVIVLGVMIAVHGARNGWMPGGGFPNALGFLSVTLGDILLFTIFVAAGLFARRRPEAHKRLMLLATVGGLLSPAITRIPYVKGQPLPMLGLMLLFVAAGPVHDFITRRRVHPVYVWGGLLILASFPVRRVIGMSETWQRVAGWVIG